MTQICHFPVSGTLLFSGFPQKMFPFPGFLFLFLFLSAFPLSYMPRCEIMKIQLQFLGVHHAHYTDMYTFYISVCNIGYNGTSSAPGTQASCTPCKNEYQDEVGMETCKKCPEGITYTVPESAAKDKTQCGKRKHFLI